MSDHSQCAAKYHLDCLGLCADPAKWQIAAVLMLNFDIHTESKYWLGYRPRSAIYLQYNIAMSCTVVPCPFNLQHSTLSFAFIRGVYLASYFWIRCYVVWYRFQKSKVQGNKIAGSPCLPEPPLLVQGCQLSQVGGIRPCCRHRTWRASCYGTIWQNVCWSSWSMLRPTYPSFIVFWQKMKCQNVPDYFLICHNAQRSCFYGPMNRPAYPVESV